MKLFSLLATGLTLMVSASLVVAADAGEALAPLRSLRRRTRGARRRGDLR